MPFPAGSCQAAPAVGNPRLHQPWLDAQPSAQAGGQVLVVDVIEVLLRGADQVPGLSGVTQRSVVETSQVASMVEKHDGVQVDRERVQAGTDNFVGRRHVLGQAWVGNGRMGMGLALALLHGGTFAAAVALVWWRDHAAVSWPHRRQTAVTA